MPKQPKKREPGRPRLTADEAKAKIVPVRFTAAEFERVAIAAQNAKQTVSQWVRCTLRSATGGEIEQIRKFPRAPDRAAGVH